MKKFTTLAVALSLVAVGAAAEVRYSTDQVHRIERPDGAPRTVAEGMRRVAGVRRASVIQLDIADFGFIIPIAGNAAGSLGTYFRSDVSIANHADVPQRIAVGWLAAGRDNTTEPLQYFTIPANTTQMTDDYVGTVLNKTGLGAILVLGVGAGADPDIDDSALLDGYSRIWTRQPNSTGTVSQNFDAVSLFDLIGASTAYINGMKQSSAFRTNVGIVNLDEGNRTFIVRSMQTGANINITVPPFSVIQTGGPANSADANGNASFTIDSLSPDLEFWSGYGSSTDNVTGDGWVSRAKQSLF